MPIFVECLSQTDIVHESTFLRHESLSRLSPARPTWYNPGMPDLSFARNAFLSRGGKNGDRRNGGVSRSLASWTFLSVGGQMEFTGERLVPTVPGYDDLFLEHISRYVLASALVEDARVLDADCGCGNSSYPMSDDLGTNRNLVRERDEVIRRLRTEIQTQAENFKREIGSLELLRDRSQERIAALETEIEKLRQQRATP